MCSPFPARGCRTRVMLLVGLAVLLLPELHAASAQNVEVPVRDPETTLRINPEDRDVGLKRMEILDKALAPELVRKKDTLVKMKEEDYNRKIGELVQRLTTPIGRNTVITHIDVDFLDPGFERQVQATQNVRVTILLGQDGFAKWAAGKPSTAAAREALRTLVSDAFDIPPGQISVVVTPN